MLIGIYKELGRDNDANRAMEMYEKARFYTQGEVHFKNGLSAYFGKRYDAAAVEFKKSIESNPSNPVSHSNLGYVFYDMGFMNKAYEYQREAIDIDPNYANAHYGLALIYKKWGNMNMAKNHWEAYLRIEPSGFFSRRAMDELEDIM